MKVTARWRIERGGDIAYQGCKGSALVQTGNRVQKGYCVRMPGIFEKFFCGSLLYDPSQIHDGHRIRHIADDAQVMASCCTLEAFHCKAHIAGVVLNQ